MCKLAGIVPKTTTHRTDARAVPTILTSMMLKNSETTNKDGFGIGIVPTLQVYKKMEAATTGLLQPEVLKWIWGNYKAGQVMIGHTRLSTTAKGNNIDQNAHPFVVGEWMLAHNGHIGNYTELHKAEGLPDEVQVDSEVALHMLVKEWGDLETLTLADIQRGLDPLEGGYAFIIGHSTEPDRLYLIRGSNPLSVYTNERYWLVNTDGQMLSELNKILWLTGISSGQWQEPTKELELPANHAFVLDRDRLTDLGEIHPKVVSRSVTVWHGGAWTPAERAVTIQPTMTSVPGQSTAVSAGGSDERPTNDVIDLAQAASQVAALQSFLSAQGLEERDLQDMLNCLPSVVPPTIWEITGYDLELLKEWFAYLGTLGTSVYDPSFMDARREHWLKFLDKVGKGQSPYAVAERIEPSFNRPWYLNTSIMLQRLVSEWSVDDEPKG